MKALFFWLLDPYPPVLSPCTSFLGYGEADLGEGFQSIDHHSAPSTFTF